MLADERLDACGIEIADRHDRHSVGPVELSIEVAQALGRETTSALQATRSARGPCISSLRRERASARLPCASPAPCRPRHSSMTTPRSRSISVVSSEMPRGKVAQRVEPPHEDLFAVGRELEHVHRLVKAGVRVDVRTEPRTDRFEVVDELSRLEMCRAVECHVLEQMCEAALIVCLVYRARLDDETHRRSLFGLGVLSNEKRQAVRQPASANRGVERQRRRQILRGGANGGAQDEQQQVCCVDAAQNTASESHDSSSFICHP